VTKGPNVVRQTVTILKETGLDFVQDEAMNIEFVWYKTIGVDRIVQYHEQKYESKPTINNNTRVITSSVVYILP
jgi:hypothetical protein